MRRTVVETARGSVVEYDESPEERVQRVQDAAMRSGSRLAPLTAGQRAVLKAVHVRRRLRRAG